MLAFPIVDLLDETRCYEMLVTVLHPEGLRCPQGHMLPAHQAPHRRERAPLVDFRCRVCGAVFNAFTNTALHRARYSCPLLVLILRGFLHGMTTMHLAEELHLNRPHLLAFRHRIHGLALARLSPPGRLRSTHRGRRNVPKCRRKGDSAPRSRRPTADAGESV